MLSKIVHINIRWSSRANTFNSYTLFVLISASFNILHHPLIFSRFSIQVKHFVKMLWGIQNLLFHICRHHSLLPPTNSYCFLNYKSVIFLFTRNWCLSVHSKISFLRTNNYGSTLLKSFTISLDLGTYSRKTLQY